MDDGIGLQIAHCEWQMTDEVMLVGQCSMVSRRWNRDICDRVVRK
jgi:hypothetical protein